VSLFPNLEKDKNEEGEHATMGRALGVFCFPEPERLSTYTSPQFILDFWNKKWLRKEKTVVNARVLYTTLKWKSGDWPGEEHIVWRLCKFVPGKTERGRAFGTSYCLWNEHVRYCNFF
jgi:hypothetical protein